MRKLLLLFVLVFFSVSPSFYGSPQLTSVENLAPVSTAVYITKTGSKYHLGNCRYLSKSKIKTNKSKAIKSGYTACKVCKP